MKLSFKPVPLVVLSLTSLLAASCSSSSSGPTGAGGPASIPAPAAAAPAPAKEPTLRTTAEARGFLIGAAINISPFKDDAKYRQTLAEHFNVIVPENEMKFSRLHPEKDTYQFDKADAIVDFAVHNKMAVRGHTLVWHRSMPKWLEEGKWEKEQLKAVLESHIKTVVSRYKGKVAAWDVVNEAFNDDGSFRDNLWHKVIGPEYIELAFRWAHEADPQALLFYNDYTNESITTKSTRIYNMVKELKEKQVPIHGVGWQMHIRTMNYATPEKVRQNLKRLGEVGVQVHITEMDVKVNDNKTNTDEQKLKLQADVYSNMLSVCLSEPNCKALLTWGVADKHSFIREEDRTEKPLLFDDQYGRKPAYEALLGILSRK